MGEYFEDLENRLRHVRAAVWGLTWPLKVKVHEMQVPSGIPALGPWIGFKQVALARSKNKVRRDRG
jgi:hypothetical protein